MAKTIEPSENSVIFWQEYTEDDVGEPAILIEVYSDRISLHQDGECVSILKHELNDFIKALNEAGSIGV